MKRGTETKSLSSSGIQYPVDFQAYSPGFRLAT